MNKLQLTNGEKVIISKLGDDREYPGVVVGKAINHVVDFYVVQTEGRPFAAEQYDFDCIVVSECCLARV